MSPTDPRPDLVTVIAHMRPQSGKEQELRDALEAGVERRPHGRTGASDRLTRVPTVGSDVGGHGEEPSRYDMLGLLLNDSAVL